MPQRLHKNEREIRVRGITPDLQQTLKNIAANEGVTLSQMLRRQLRLIAAEAPEYKKRHPDA